MTQISQSIQISLFVVNMHELYFCPNQDNMFVNVKMKTPMLGNPHHCDSANGYCKSIVVTDVRG